MTSSKSLARLCLLCLAAAVPAAARAQGAIISDTDRDAPFDYGYGLNVHVPSRQMTLWNRVTAAFWPKPITPFATQRAIAALPAASLAAPATGSSSAATTGLFGAVLPWPIIPIHMALQPDGRVLTYGTNEQGKQGAALYYDVWDPTQPYATSHTVLPNTTTTDIFCSGMALLANGNFLITGGDLTIDNKRNYSNPQATFFNSATASLTADGVMTYPRWYPSNVPLANGDQLIMGGRSSQDPQVPVTIAEYYSTAANTFTVLPGTNTNNQVTWYYPKTFVTSAGGIDQIDNTGHLATYTTSSGGSFSVLRGRAAASLYDLPTVMYSPSQLLSIRVASTTSDAYTFQNIDLRGASPVVTTLPSVPGEGREWANMTVLADGTIFVNGGSGTDNVLSMVSTTAALYNPATTAWTPAATAAEPRLYHSAALLLPDGTVLTGGGGAPGPINQLNAEIFYPPYLFVNDGSGDFATRPVIAAAPTSLPAGASITLTMGSTDPIAAVHLIRVGAVTHSTSVQSRFIAAAFSQSGTALTLTAPTNSNDFLPGYWMIFAIDKAGVPAIAPIVNVPVPN